MLDNTPQAGVPADSPRTVCPHLGLQGDRTVARSAPTAGHRCYARSPLFAPDDAHQLTHCLGGRHAQCPYYRELHFADRLATDRDRRLPSSAWRWVGIAFVTALLAMSVLLVTSVLPQVYAGLDWAAAPSAVEAATPTLTPLPLNPTQAPPATVALQAPPRFVTPTPVAGGSVVYLAPAAASAGWWASVDDRPNHLGDSYLYAGRFDGKTYTAAVRFDLGSVPRGAQLQEAALRLHGLRDDRLAADAPYVWTLELLPGSALADLAQVDFATLAATSAAHGLQPSIVAADLAAGRDNVWILDPAQTAWLDALVQQGAPAVLVRISAVPAADAPAVDSLFAWDSGLGPESSGNRPGLLLSLGPAPITPPPLQTVPVLVATLTPTPANALTAVADSATATSMAQTVGTYTPVPFDVVTPTPLPQNLATVQVQAAAQGLPPVLVETPTPANAETAAAQAAYATAVALTTGTFTPAPPGYVTPVLVLPSPPAQNVATAAAVSVLATARAQSGEATPTPLPYNAVLAEYVYATPTPANAATAQMMVADATARAQTTGIPTPLAWNAVVITPVAPPAATATPAPVPPSCPDGRAVIERPGVFQQFTDAAGVFGIATHENFAYYKLEYAPGVNPAEGYTVFARGDRAVTTVLPEDRRRLGGLDRYAAPIVVEETEFGTGVLLRRTDYVYLPDGPYTLRLTVVDDTGNFPPPCEVVVEFTTVQEETP